MENKSATEWLFQQLWDTPKDKFTWNSILNQAKEMEKKQIIDAYNNGDLRSADLYYDETYGSKGSDDINPLTISTQGIELPSDDDIEAYISSFPFIKHLDDGQYNDGVIVGAELGIEWYREQLKKKQ